MTAAMDTYAPVMCRNMSPGITVIAASPKSDHEVIFEGANSPNGGDIQPIPMELLRAPAFARAVQQGLLKVEEGSDNPFVKAALTRQTDAYWKRMETDKLAALETMEAPKEDDLIGITCIGPGTRPGAQCDTMVPVRAREKDSKPPLCDVHAHLLESCVRRGSGEWKIEG